MHDDVADRGIVQADGVANLGGRIPVRARGLIQGIQCPADES